MPKKTAKTAYLYARFSTPEQAEGDSERRQSEAAKRWCKTHQVMLDESYRDLGVSAHRGRHRTKGALAGFLAAVACGKIAKDSILIVESLDRLSREQLRDARELFESLLKSNIEVVTLVPERHYTEASLNDPLAQVEVIFIAHRAHAESALKSERVGEAWRNKKEHASTAKLTAQCPSWLKLRKDRREFEQIAEAVKAVRTIFAWCSEGIGTAGITKRLHAEQVPPIGRGGKQGKTWHKSYVTKILNNRAVIGEYQPHVGHAGPERKPVGEPIPNYYPAIISEAIFYKAQAALQGRKNQQGPTGKQVANLFTGQVIDCRDSSAMHLVDKGSRSSGPHLVSYAAQRGVEGAKYIMLPYAPFEQAILTVLTELSANDILPAQSNTNDLDELLAEEEGRLAKLEIKQAKTKARLLDDDDFDALLDVLKTLDQEIKSCQASIEQITSEQHNASADALCDAQGIVPLLQEANGETLVELRTRLKAKLRSFISAIWVFVAAHKRYRFAVIDIHFRAGGHRFLQIVTHPQGGYFFGDNETLPTTEGRDFRDIKVHATIDRLMPKFTELWESARCS